MVARMLLKRGITVCEEWKDFKNFYNDMVEKPSDKTLDRIDNNGNYCKENCRWATAKQQHNNKRNSHYLAFNGSKKTIAEWSVCLKLKEKTLRARISRGWSVERALTTK